MPGANNNIPRQGHEDETAPTPRSSWEPTNEPVPGSVILFMCFLGIGIVLGNSSGTVRLAQCCAVLLGLFILVFFLGLARLLMDTLIRAMASFLIFAFMGGLICILLCEIQGIPISTARINWIIIPLPLGYGYSLQMWLRW